jgi:uncharacterized protein
MKLHLAKVAGQNQFTGYGNGYIEVNKQRYEHSLVVTLEAIHDSWSVASLDALNTESVHFLLTLKPEILLLGTGATLRRCAISRARKSAWNRWPPPPPAAHSTS